MSETSPSVSSLPTGIVPAGAAPVFSKGCLLALERSTGEVRWTRCEDASVVGRVDGATLVARTVYLPASAGSPSGTLAVVGDDGVERWTRSGVLFPVVGVDSIVVAAIGVDGPIEGIDARTGATVWSHPASEGRPIGATAGVVVELTDGISTAPTPGLPSRAATLRAVDAGSGTQVWTREVDVFDAPTGMAASLNGVEIPPASVGNGYVAVPGPGSGRTPMATLVIDATTGAEVVTADGVLGAAATDQVLSEWRWSTSGQTELAFYQVTTGASMSIVPGVIVAYPPGPTRNRGAPGTGTHVWVTGNVMSGEDPYWAVVDAADGREVWRVDDGSPVVWDDTTVLTADASKLALYDIATGTPVWRTEVDEPAGPVSVMSAAFGSDLIIVDADKVAGD